MRAALGLTGISSMEEALYLQMQAAEQRREFELQQMLVCERLAQESRLGVLPPDLQQQYSRLLLGDPINRGVEERMLLTNRLRAQAEEEIRRRQQLLAEHPTQLLLQQHSPLSPAASASVKPSGSSAKVPTVGPQKVPTINQSMLRDIAADSLAGNAVRRGEVDRRKFAKPDTNLVSSASPNAKKRPRSDTNDSSDLVELSPASQKAGKQDKAPKQKKRVLSPRSRKSGKVGGKRGRKPKKEKPETKYTKYGRVFLLPKMGRSPAAPAPPTPPSPAKVTIGDLLDAAHTEDKSDTVAATLTSMKFDANIEWSDSDEESSSTETAEDPRCESSLPVERVVRLPNFISILPKFEEEPCFVDPPSSKKKHKGLLDDDSVEDNDAGTENVKQSKATKNPKNASSEDTFKDLPYLVDKWWPSSLDIKKERKLRGQSDVDIEIENAVTVGTEQKFRVNLERIKDRLSHQVQPGMLEKIPHCKIHRMLLQRRKSAAPELVYCWQVTELYPNDAMVCCSQCGTWRHTACGGHHKPFSVREATENPFVPICDRCFEEEKILEDNSVARKRLDRQRCEQIRRGLSTSVAMRQASFSKHGGSYKWPLGSVSATHIGGHTRSVHTRHDKAEKQWTDMATKLSKGYGSKPKEKIKHRTKELERLLVSVEDAGT